MGHRAMVRGIGVGVGENGSNVPAVVLETRDESLPIVIASGQAQAIRLSLSDGQFEYPLTHDLLTEMATEFGGTINNIRIDGLPNGTFLAKVDAERYHDGRARSVVFDARPSDTITLAIRVGCPILVSGGVPDAVGQSPEALNADFDE